MLFSRRKAEIEILASLKVASDVSLDKYTPLPAAQNPLIAYVVKRLNHHLCNLQILEM